MSIRVEHHGIERRDVGIHIEIHLVVECVGGGELNHLVIGVQCRKGLPLRVVVLPLSRWSGTFSVAHLRYAHHAHCYEKNQGCRWKRFHAKMTPVSDDW